MSKMVTAYLEVPKLRAPKQNSIHQNNNTFVFIISLNKTRFRSQLDFRCSPMIYQQWSRMVVWTVMNNGAIGGMSFRDKAVEIRVRGESKIMGLKGHISYTLFSTPHTLLVTSVIRTKQPCSVRAAGKP